MLASALGALALGVVLAPAARADNVLPDPGWQVAASSPTTNLSDGQFVTLTVKSRSNIAVNSIEVRECRLGPDYAQDPLGISPNGGNCPPIPISSSADDVLARSAGDGLTVLARSPQGANFNFRVGTGVVNWRAGGVDRSLTCGPSDRCALVAKLTIGQSSAFSVTPLEFVDADPIASCGGPAADVLATGGSDEMSDAWAAWTRKYCAGTPGGAPSRAAFTGEGEAVTSFATGNLDLVYTAAGYDKRVGLLGADATTPRATVAVPIGLNASVIAAGGGYHQIISGLPIGDKVPYPEGVLSMTAGEAGALVGGGIPWVFRIGGQYLSSFLARNSALSNVATATGASFMGPSEELSSTWFMTNHLATLAPTEFVKPTESPIVSRPATKSLAKTTPTYDDIFLFTGRPVLGRNTLAAFLSPNDGPMWVMTDRVTARALNLTPVALQNSAGSFVAPTSASMAAAIPTMKANDQGILVPDPKPASTAGVSATAADAYPVTYVEYALVPAEPLVGDNCTPRTGSQTLLTKWLNYITGAGQQNLPAGLEPLTPELATQAKAAIAKVGASPVTGECATTLQGLETGGGAPGLVLPGSVLPGGSIPGVVPGAVPGAVAAAAEAKKKVDLRNAIPAFAGSTVPSGNAGVAALLGIVFVTSLGIFLTAQPQMAGAGAGAAAGAAGVAGAGAAGARPGRRRGAFLVVLWIGIGAACFGLVVYSLEPLFQQRDQQALLGRYQQELKKAAYATQGLPQKGEGSSLTTPPEVGAPVGVLEIGAFKSQQVVVEGVSSSETRKGPGHVPGTAGLGQPGNAVVVARRNSFGGSFRHLADLTKGVPIVVTTTQGQSVYEVQSVEERQIVDKVKNEKTQIQRDGNLGDHSLFGPSKGDQLTLVTSASATPWNTDTATVVVAKLRGNPYEPTAQGARTREQTNIGGDGTAWPAIILVLTLYVLAIGGSILVYRRMQFRVAYLLTIAPIVALTVITAETLSRLIPSWT